MPRKNVLMTWLPNAGVAGPPGEVAAALSKSGLTVNGGGWDRDDATGWLPTAEHLIQSPNVDLWMLVGTADDFANAAVRYGLSLARIRVGAQRQRVPALVVACLDEQPRASVLPPLLQQAQLLGPPTTDWGGRCVAAAMRDAIPEAPSDYRLNVIANASLGHWFEVGPAGDCAWGGAIFGVDEGEITHHGVGKRGELPERCTLEYPLEGARVEVDGRRLTCWAVNNRLEPGNSYYVRVTGSPAHILFGEHPDLSDQTARLLALA